MKILNNPTREEHYKKILDNENYWLEVVIHSEDVSPIIRKIPSQVIQSIKNGPTYLLISNEFECFDSVIEEIYNCLIIKFTIPEDKILFLSGSKDVKNSTISIKNKINNKYGTDYKVIDSRFFNSAERIIAKNCKNISNSCDFKRNLLLNGKLNYKKHYLCLNRRWRLHRPTLIALLNSKGILDKGYVSLGLNELNETLDQIYDNIIEINKNNQVLLDLLITNKTQNLKIENLTIDAKNFEDKKVELSNHLEQYYTSSFISIVTETYFYDFNSVFLTEKTFKPIAYKQPFIIVGAPRSLKFLKELGYKTFHPYIDESYDDEVNDSKRMLMILNEVEKICNLSDQDLKKISLGIKDICYHNYQVLASR